MQLPRKAVLIRICIYGPLLAYFGYMACQKYQAEKAEQNAAPEIDGPKHTFTLPDGKSVEVVEISEDQARQMGLDPNQREPASKAEPPAKAAGAEDPKSPPPAPPGAN